MSDFTDYIQGYIGNMSGTLGWGMDTLNFIADEALELYGVATEAEADDVKKAHVLLRYKTMERILIDFSGDVNYRADGESFNLSDVPDRYMKMMAIAKAQALPYLPEGEITQGRVTYPDDPYSIDGQIEHAP